MSRYLVRRFLYVIVVLWIVSVVSFLIIQLPPGDYLTSYIMQLQESGSEVGAAEIAALKRQYGLDLPIPLRYVNWAAGTCGATSGSRSSGTGPSRTWSGSGSPSPP